jgi:hypothetical protein
MPCKVCPVREATRSNAMFRAGLSRVGFDLNYDYDSDFGKLMWFHKPMIGSRQFLCS